MKSLSHPGIDLPIAVSRKALGVCLLLTLLTLVCWPWLAEAAAQPAVDTDWIAQLPAGSLDATMDPQRLLERLLSRRHATSTAAVATPPSATPSATGKARLHLALGHQLRQAGKQEAAISHYGLAARLDPELAEAHLIHGSLLGQRGRFRQAARAFAWLIELDPGDVRGYRGRALALQRSGMSWLAKSTLEDGLSQAGESPELLHLLARLLATSNDATLRDGGRAVELAQRALAASAQAPYAETMAMALAEAGRFSDATAVQRNLLQQAKNSAGNADWIAQLEQRLALFEAGKAWHEP